ncbi:MAG TPA: hypothetical protein PKC59_06735, partial [Burkholderiaceae bacterium]|nr:hypothetical protein [Burkholderiaceae bacterium]
RWRMLQRGPLVHGTTTLLLWRDGGGALKLAAFDAAWAPLAGFGSAGVTTVNAAVRTEADRKPALCVLGDAVGIGWVKAGSDDLQFQRWHPASGTAIDTNPVLLGAATQCGPHGWLQHDGTQWAAFWAGPVGAQQRVLMRRIGANGTPDASVRTIVSQAAALGAPHAVHDPARGMWLVAWHSTDAAQRGILTRRLDATGTPLGVTAERPVPLTVDGRSPQLDLHPDGGFVLGWEDAGGGSFDVYVAFLNADGTAGPVSRLQVSDSPQPTAGFSMVVDTHGVVPVWQSDDETDSNVLGLYLLGITKQGVFAAQADPATPLLENQTYVRQTLATQPETDRVAVAMCWGGGDWYLLRHTGSTFISDLELVHTSADGVPDTAFGAGGARRLERAFSFEALSLAWRGNLLAASSSHGPENTVYLARTDGRLVDSFGRHGLLKLNEAAAAPVYGQVALQGTGASLQLLVAFGRHDPAGSHEIRWTVRNRTGAADVAPRTLARAAGTAKQGWCHWLASETPRHLVAAWHAPAGAPPLMQVLVQRFTLAGAPQTGQPTPFVLTALPGEAINATIAPRPVQFQPAFPVSAADLAASRQREFGAAWQHQSPGGRWEIRFSCLQRSGQPVATAGQFDVAVVASATDHATEPQIVWHGNGYGLAWLQRPAAGGNAVLMFTVLNPLGQRPNLAPIGPAAPAADFAVTAAGVDVQRFHLVWGGAAFRITWTEVDGGQLLHRQRGLSVPQPASGARYDAPFQQPSAALLKATLINGATNLRNTALPNIGNNVHDGYGWGRVNLRQSLSPAQPVSFHVRDDGCVAAGRRVRYALRIRRGTQLLRITMAWTDPPGVDLVNHLHLRVTTPPFPACGARVFHGNRFGSAAGTQHLSRAVTAPEPPFEDTHTVQQVVLAAPPALPEGDYLVEVICSQLPGGAFDRFPGQPFALVCVGSGPELRTAANAPAAPIGVY